MWFCCCASNVLKSAIDLSNVDISVDITVDVSMNIVDISNIQIHLDISNNERIVSFVTNTDSDFNNISKISNDAIQILADEKEILSDNLHDPQHIINVKEEFLAINLEEPLLQLADK